MTLPSFFSGTLISTANIGSSTQLNDLLEATNYCPLSQYHNQCEIESYISPFPTYLVKRAREEHAAVVGVVAAAGTYPHERSDEGHHRPPDWCEREAALPSQLVAAAAV